MSFFLHFKNFFTHVAHSVKKWCVQLISRHQIYGQKLARRSKNPHKPKPFIAFDHKLIELW